MDGHFVPNITIGPGVVAAIRPHTQEVLDVHLMIAPADPYIEAFAKAGADIITVHAEAGPHLDRSLQLIRSLGKKAGVSLNPSTPESALEHVLDRLDLILVMTVNPGFGGQAFIPAMRRQDRAAARDDRRAADPSRGRWRDQHADTAGACARAGADVLVAGSAVFTGRQLRRRTSPPSAQPQRRPSRSIPLIQSTQTPLPLGRGQTELLWPTNTLLHRVVLPVRCRPCR